MRGLRLLSRFFVRLLLCAVLLVVLPADVAFAAQQKAGPRAKSGGAQHAVAGASDWSGNIKTMRFHRRGCRYFTCSNCVASFADPQEARRKGFRPCKVCIGK